MNDGGKIIKNCIEYVRQADIQNGEQGGARMRLIDADDFMERMECDTDICAEMEQDGLKALKKYLDLQPTAYDVDKIVEKLEEEREYAYADFEEYVNEVSPCLDVEYDDLFHRGLERAIKIVKAGGKNE